MPSAPLRIAVLECDITVGKLSEGYGVIFERLFETAANDENLRETNGGTVPELQFTKFNIVEDPEKYPQLDDIDAVVLSGSKFNAHDNDPWILELVSFTTSVLQQTRVRLLGICFGHQILGRALGLPVGRNDAGWELAVTDVTLTARARALFKLPEDGIMRIHQMHRDIVREQTTLPPGVEALGSTARCQVQGLYAANRFVSVQGHPEFSGPVVEELMVKRHDGGIIDDETFRDAMKRVQSTHDGVAIAAGMLRFLLQ